MISLDTAATEVFQILRSYDYAVMMYDDDGDQVYEPEGARRFFAKPENLLVSLVDNGENSSIRLYMGKSTDIEDVMGLNQTLRQTATKYNMMFNVKRSGGDLAPADFATKASVTETKKEEPMNILEGMYGTTRSSYLKLENARMIVRHTKKIDETVIGSRGRHIDAIFVENAVGERFLFPTRQLSPARAMTQHVNHGGAFADVVGQQIMRMANDYANLGAASGHIASNTEVLGESAQPVREACRNRMYEMRKCFERLARAGGYISEAQRIEEETSTLTENEGGEAVDITEVRELITVEGVELDESLLMSVAEAMKYGQDMGEGATTEIKEPACPTCHGKGMTADQSDTCPSCAGSGVDSVNIAGRMLSRQAWNNFKDGRLEVFNPPSDEMADPDGKGAGKPNFLNKDAEMAYLVSQIVPEVKNDSMMNFLGYVAEELPKRNPPERQMSLRRVALHAIRLAGLHIDIAPKNEAVREFSEWMSGFNASTVLAEHEPGDHDYGYEASSDEDIERDAEEVANDFDPQDFLNTCGDDFSWGDDSLSPEEKEFSKDFILKTLTHYLNNKVNDATGLSGDTYDMSDIARDLFDRVEPLLTGAGYSLSEGELSREDVLIPTNQGDDLKREVTAASGQDPDTGEEVPTDMNYIERLRTLSGMPWNR